MVKRMKYAWLQLLLATLIAGCAASCLKDYPEGICDNEAAGGVDLVLLMQMPVSPGTRADNGLAAERVRDLRVVIVSLPVDSKGVTVPDETAVIEYNEVVRNVVFDQQGQHELHFRHILPDRQKRIYFLANCEPAYNGYLDLRDAAGSPVDPSRDANYLPAGSGKAPIEEAVFTAPIGPYGDTHIYQRAETIADYCVPITAVHELPMPTIAELQRVATPGPVLTCRIEKPLYLVRAVNKIDFTIANNTGSTELDTSGQPFIRPTDVRIKSFVISRISTGKSYLFAHLDPQDPLFADYQPTPEEQLLPVYARSDLNPAWMRWLSAEAEKTQDDNYRAYEWLTSYELPAPVVHVDSPLQSFNADPDAGWVASTRKADRTLPTEWTAPAVYFPESFYVPEASESADGETAADPSEQEYLLTCVFEQRRTNADGSETIKTIEHQSVLPQLKSLFRDTHVKVRFSVTDNADVQLDLVALPWTLAPEEVWHYTHTVTVPVDGFLQWKNDTYANDDKAACRLLMKTEDVPAEGTFKIVSPVNDEWYAYLIPLTGDPDAFFFVDESGREIATPHGIIDGQSAATVRIRHREMMVSEQNTAKLQIMVRTADNRYMEADVCDGAATYYTIIQNRNSF